MTLRLESDDRDALARVAELEDRSMQEVAQSAVREYVAARDMPHRARRSIAETMPEYRELFDRLGRA